MLADPCLKHATRCAFLSCPSSYTDQGGEESEDYESEEQLQHRILRAALEFVPTHGWTADAIAEGAKVHAKGWCSEWR